MFLILSFFYSSFFLRFQFVLMQVELSKVFPSEYHHLYMNYSLENNSNLSVSHSFKPSSNFSLKFLLNFNPHLYFSAFLFFSRLLPLSRTFFYLSQSSPTLIHTLTNFFFFFYFFISRVIFSDFFLNL